MIDEKKLIECIHAYFVNVLESDESNEIDNRILKINKDICNITREQPQVNYPLGDCIGDCKNCWKTKLVNPTWIQRSEGLPKEEGFYFCTVVGYHREDYRKVVKCWFSKNYNDFMEYGSRVIAWQPIPKPYEGW